MVTVEGRMRYFDGRGHFKVKEHFKTKKEADKFMRLMSPRKKRGEWAKITKYRKPKRRSSYGYNIMGSGGLRW